MCWILFFFLDLLLLLILLLQQREQKQIAYQEQEQQTNHILKIKSEIDNKMKRPKPKGISISKKDNKFESNSKDDSKNSSVKKVFLAESLIENAKTPEDLKKLLGTNKEEILRNQLEKRQKMIEIQKDLFTLPENLNVVNQNNDDHVDNIVRLSAAGILKL